jgi:hypothetical protein
VTSASVQEPVAMPDRIFELAYGFRRAKVLLCAVELDLFTVLGDGPLDLTELCSRVGLHQRNAGDFLDALVALGMLDRDRNGLYRNAPEAGLYLDRHKPTFIGGVLDHLNTREYGLWNGLTAAIRSGRPVAGGAAVSFETHYADPATRDAFVKRMTGATLLIARDIARRFPWQYRSTVFDIGTAQGCFPVEIARAHPHVTGGGFDLPILKSSFDSYVREQGVSERMRFLAGDFLCDPLPQADVLVMGRVLHNWDFPTKKLLLEKAHAALTPGGALIVYERMIDDERRTSTDALLSSLHMRLVSEGGFDYSGAECMDWMRESGFGEISIEKTVLGHTIIVASKPAR